MKLRGNKMLGLAVGEKSILIAEVSAVLGQCQVARSGVFSYTEGATLAQPEALGEALHNYLKQEGFSSKPAIFGIPAKWVLTKSKELPPVDPALAADMLRIQVESEFSAELKDLVYDYAGQSSAAGLSEVLLAATPRRHIDAIHKIAETARLDVQGIAPTGVVLSVATTRGNSDALVLSITPSSTELAAQRGASPSLLRHVGSSSAVTAAVAGEVRRASLLMPRNGTTAGNGSANGREHWQIVVWDDAGLDLGARRAATDALGPSSRSGDFSSLGAGELPAGVSACAAAVALAVAGLTDADLPIDFLHSRLAPPKKPVLPRQTVLAIAAGVAILMIVILMFVDRYRRENDLAAKQYQLLEKQKLLTGAEPEIARNEYARNWHASPRYLDCLRDLTNDFPADGQLFVTSFTMHDNMKGEIGGKSTANNDRSVRDLVEKLRTRRDKRFLDVEMKSVDKRQIRAGQEISFTITLKYVPVDPAQP
jgi:hypothetical protein